MGISTFTSKEFVIFCRVSKIGNVNRQLPFALFDSGRRFPASVWMTLLVIRMVVKTRFGRQLVVWTTPKSMPRNGDCRSTLYIYIWHLLFYERPIYLSNPVAWYLRFQRKVFGVISSLTTALCWCSSWFYVVPLWSVIFWLQKWAGRVEGIALGFSSVRRFVVFEHGANDCLSIASYPTGCPGGTWWVTAPWHTAIHVT